MEILSYYFKIVCFFILLFEKTHSSPDLQLCGNEDCTSKFQHFTQSIYSHIVCRKAVCFEVLTLSDKIAIILYHYIF